MNQDSVEHEEGNSKDKIVHHDPDEGWREKTSVGSEGACGNPDRRKSHDDGKGRQGDGFGPSGSLSPE